MGKLKQVIQSLDPDSRQYLEHYLEEAPDWLLEAFQVIRVAKNALFIEERDAADQIYILVRGRVLAVDYRVRDIAYGFFEFVPIEVFGAMEIICEMEQYMSSLLTLEESFFLKIRRSIFEKWLRSDNKAFQMQTRKVGRYLLKQARRERLNVLLPGLERVALVLMRMYEVYAQEHHGKLYLSRKDFAETTGLCERMITRILKELEQKEYLTREGWCIHMSQEQYQKLKTLVENKIDGMEEMER